MKTNLLFAVSSSLLLLSSSLSLSALGAAGPLTSTSSGVPSANARVWEYSDAACTQGGKVYYALPRGVCVGDAATGGSLRVTCGSGAAPTFERFAANTACGGTPVVSAVGTAEATYTPLVATSCIAATAAVNSTATSSVVIQCAEAEDPFASRFRFADSSCSVRVDVTSRPSQESETEFGECINNSPYSFNSYASFVDSGRLYDYSYSKPNCSTADITSVATVELGACLEKPVQSYNYTSGSYVWTSEWRMITAPSDATLRGAAPPTSWPPAAENTLAFSYQCGDQTCSRGCRVAQAIKLGSCRAVSGGRTSYPVVNWEKDLCTADTKNGGTASYFDSTCSASKLFNLNLNPAENKCTDGRYLNCGNGKGVAPEARVPASLPTLVEVSYVERREERAEALAVGAAEGATCTGDWLELTYMALDMCFPVSQGGSIGAAKWTLVNSTVSGQSYAPTSGSTVAAPDCSGTPSYSGETYQLGACNYGIQYLTVAQAAAQDGISIDTTTVSNGVDGNGAPGTGSSASALSVSGLAFFAVTLVSMLAQLMQ